MPTLDDIRSYLSQGLQGLTSHLGIPPGEIKNPQGQTVFPTNPLERGLQTSDAAAQQAAAAFMPGPRLPAAAYHGSTRQFLMPDLLQGGSRGGIPSDVGTSYLSPSKNLARGYGQFVSKHQVNLNNSSVYDVGKLVKDPEFIKDMAQSWYEISTRNEYLKKFASTPEGMKRIEDGWNRILGKIANPENKFGHVEYDPTITGAIIKRARAEGRSVAVVKNLAEGKGKPADQYIVLDESGFVGAKK